jgi:hypothetical protein
MDFTEDSKKLISLFSENVKRLPNSFYLKKKLVKNTMLILRKELNDTMKQVNTLLKNDKIKQKLIIYDERKRSALPPYLDSIFLAPYIKNYIERYFYGYMSYEFTIYNKHVNIMFGLLHDGDDTKYQMQNNSYIKKMLLWLLMAMKHSKDQCGKKLTIHCFLTPFKKKIPEHSYHIISHEHCNSGLTTPCKKNGSIFIFRKEEFLKVFIHETFHILGLDFSSLNTDLLKMKMFSIFPIQSEMVCEEAYTEFWAVLMNAIILSYFETIDKPNKDFLDYLDVMVRLENAFSIYQLNKILSFMNLSYQSLYLNDETSVAARLYLYREKTNVFAYYILKTILLFHSDAFIKWCCMNNVGVFDFFNSAATVDEFGSFIEEHYASDDFLRQIDLSRFTDFVGDNKELLKHEKFFKETMRMTVCELN